ncbi:MAG: S8 family peptidase [Candidatus Margulisiibacteriota bacterium]
MNRQVLSAAAGWLLLSLLCLAHADYAPGQLAVKFKPGQVKTTSVSALSVKRGVAEIKKLFTAASVSALSVKYGGYRIKKLYADALAIRPDWTYLDNQYVLVFSPEADVKKAARDFGQDPNVVTAEPVSRVRAFDVTPLDTHYAQQWGLLKISAPSGWSRTTGASEVIIAVLDTGLNYNHEDFAGKVDTVHMKDFVNGDNDPMDDFGHGTAVSGVIGAVTNNSKGIAGVDWGAKILPLKVLDSSGSGVLTDINDALADIAALKSTGTNIVAANMSLGQYNSGADKYAEENPSNLKDRCQEAYNQGIVLVAAAGNDNVDWNTYPAYYSTVIAVAATDTTDKRSVWSSGQASNYGSWVDVAAPGSGIYSTGHPESSVQENNYYGSWSGTSLASPYVAGLAGLVKAAFPASSNAQIMDQIENWTDNIDAQQDPAYVGKLGSGRINVYKTLVSAGLLANISAPAAGAYLRGTVTVSGSASGWNFGAYTLEAVSNGSVEATITSSSSQVDNNTLANWDTTTVSDGAKSLRLRVYTVDGASLETAEAVTVNNILPVAALLTPAAGATVEGRTTITGTASNAFLDHYLLEYGSGEAPVVYQTIRLGYTSVTNGALGTWESAGLSGNYTLRLTAYNQAGSAATTSEIVAIKSEAPTKEIEPQPGLPLTFALPNPFDRQSAGEVSLVYNLQGNFNTTIYLFDLNGNLIWRRTYGAGENGGKSGANNPGWNGQNLYGEGVPNGVYFYQITSDRQVIGRGKIIVLN